MLKFACINFHFKKGSFGVVHKALYKPTGAIFAVKTCHIQLPLDQHKKLLQEGMRLRQYDHPNIVKFIGIAAQRQPIMVVMEYIPGGSLLRYLKDYKHALTKKLQITMCKDAAEGMAYLESKRCIHRDLATRNCLVGDNSAVKISDFGLSREEEVYLMANLCFPVRWTAPESFTHKIFTSKSDVWSFGVLMWEIFSKGKVPYADKLDGEVMATVRGGFTMDVPEGTPKEISSLMKNCWAYNPTDRYNFARIKNELQVIYEQC
uniref:Tyrosine-protein kinase Fps85D n=1 Tax=Magallana gigas TaxID=29159 RepID=K1R927_MAGGI